ncbi:MAG: hypothetical protein E7042_00770 [Lentisphaerae bacterium]|nr:hypothetical protein [Lentisphaerota bacterium]
MKDKVNNFFVTALPKQGKRALLLITLAALPILMLFLGKSELINVEGEWAGCIRMMTGPGISDNTWYPSDARTAIYSRLVMELARLLPLTEWLIRIPAVIAALLTLSGTILLALEIFERKNAVLAGWLMLGSYGFLYWGRIGSAPMFSAAATVWCAALFYGRQRRSPSPFRSSFDFFVMFFGILLLCGYTSAIGILLLLLPQWVDMTRKKQYSKSGCGKALLGALSAFTLVALLLYVVIYSDQPSLQWDGSFFRLVNFCRRLSVESWHELVTPGSGGFPESLLHLPRLLLPWSLLIPAAAFGLWKKRDLLSADFKKLLWGMLLFFLFVGIFPFRRWGSLLPMLGPATIAMAAGLSVRLRDAETERYSELIVRGIFIVIAALFTALFCTWPLWDKLLRVEAPLMLMLISFVAGIATLALLTFGISPGNPVEKIMKLPSPLAGTILAGVVLSVLVNCVIFPQMNRFRTGRRFWQESSIAINQCDPEPETVIFYRCNIPPRGLYYLGLEQPFTKAMTPQEADKILRSCGGKAVVVSWRDPEIIQELSEVAARNRKRFNADSPLAAEALPVAFVNSDARSYKDCYATWLLEL